MDPRKLIRDPDKVKAALKELSDGRLITTKGVRIYIPARFAERGLAQIGIETYSIGIFACVVEDRYYGVYLVNAMMRLEPSSTLKIKIFDEEYYEFTFDEGATVVSSLNLVKTDTLVYNVYDEIISRGRVPWYIGYLEEAKLFDTAQKHAGANVGLNHKVTELLVSMVARDPKDRSKPVRHMLKTQDDLKKITPAFVALRSVTYSATNTTNKLAGAHFQEGLVSALNTPAENTERIEKLLRL